MRAGGIKFGECHSHNCFAANPYHNLILLTREMAVFFPRVCIHSLRLFQRLG